MTGSAFRSSLALFKICSQDDFSSRGTASQGISTPALESAMVMELVYPLYLDSLSFHGIHVSLRFKAFNEACRSIDGGIQSRTHDEAA